MSAEKQPVYIMPENVERTVGRDAQQNNILAAKLVADSLKTTLGPRGMDKMLVDATGDTVITNDGATIMEKMELEHPAAKMLVEIAKAQEVAVGDGTTTAVVLTGKLLEEAEKLLVQKIHPTVVIKGYTLAEIEAQRILREEQLTVTPEHSDILHHVVTTAMTGKGAEHLKDLFARLIISAIHKIKEGTNVDLSKIAIQKIKSQSTNDSRLIMGVIVDKERVHTDMPQNIQHAKIALITQPLEFHSIEQDAKISITNPQQMQQFAQQEETHLKNYVEHIKNSGATAVFCQKGIDELVQYYLAQHGIMAFRRIPQKQMEQLASATGATLVSRTGELTNDHLGTAKTIEEKQHDDETHTYVTGCPNPQTITILLCGSSGVVMDEMQRAIEDGMGDVRAVLTDQHIVAGAGAIEIAISRQLKEYATKFSGREQLAITAYANALESIPTALAENAGLDPIDILTELKNKHEQNFSHAGIDIRTGTVEDSLTKGIIEPAKIKTHALQSATEAANMLLRIDDVLASKPSKNNSNASYPGMAGME